jgi:hypothetical protein
VQHLRKLGQGHALDHRQLAVAHRLFVLLVGSLLLERLHEGGDALTLLCCFRVQTASFASGIRMPAAKHTTCAQASTVVPLLSKLIIVVVAGSWK